GDGARDIGKRIDLAFGFGGSKGAWERLAPEGDQTEEATVRRYRETWKADHPATVKFWYALDRAATSAVRNPGMDFRVGRVSYHYDEPFLRLTLPSDRRISYPFAKLDGQDKFGHPRLTFLDNTAGKFAPCRHGNGSWFGLLVENAVQGIARDLLACAMIRLQAAGFAVTLHVHDEIIVEMPEGAGSLEEFRQLVETTPSWAEGLPIRAKVREGQRFAKENAEPAVESLAPDSSEESPTDSNAASADEED